MKKISLLVTLYNCEENSSQTLQTLTKSLNNIIIDNSNLVIWNNGPNPIPTGHYEIFEKSGFIVHHEETLQNEALSKIYNRFIENYPAEHYVFLDDDSSLNCQFINVLNGLKDIEIGFPLLEYKGEVISPGLKKGVKPTTDTRVNKNDLVFAYGSGMVLSQKTCQKIKQKYSNIFDENFYFYAADSALCHRIQKLKISDKISFLPGFTHTSSDNEIESNEVKEFRDIEKAYAKALITFYYQSKYKRVVKIIKTALKLLISSKKHKINKSYLQGLLTGTHYKYK